MADLDIRDLNHGVVARLLQRALRHGRSFEDEVRAILEAAVANEGTPGLGTRIAARFVGIGLKDGEEIPELRGQGARPAEFE